MSRHRAELLSPGGWRRLHEGGPPFNLQKLCELRLAEEKNGRDIARLPTLDTATDLRTTG